MATGTVENFRVYDTEFHSGLSEAVGQAAIELGSGANGAINMYSLNQRGDFEKEAFFQRVEGLIQRRDNTSLADIEDKALNQGELVAVKINTRIGPVAQTIDSFKKINEDPRVFSFILGRQYGEDVVLDYLNTGLESLVAAMESQPEMVVDAEGGFTHMSLVKGVGSMGDRASRIRALVMHSKSFYDLIGDAITEKIADVANVAIFSGTTGSMGKPIFVTDSPALEQRTDPEDPTTVTGYRILGLTEAALELNESEDRTVVSDMITGKENLVMRIQGEAAFTVGVRGFAFRGEKSPTQAEIANPANWAYQFTTIKNGPGFMMLVD